MESRQRRVWHQAAGALFYTRFAQFHARQCRNSIQRASALIPCQSCGLDKKALAKQGLFKVDSGPMFARKCIREGSYCLRKLIEFALQIQGGPSSYSPTAKKL